MKKFLWIFILVLVLGAGFLSRDVLADQYKKIAYYSPCDTPITYKIGAIDKRFNISEEQFKEFVAESAQIWSTSADKKLFDYDPKGDITISLEYDQRQTLNRQINELDNKLDEQNKALEPKIEAYEQRVASFKQKAAALNQEIDNWNSKGGAPMDVYEGLIARQKALQQESQALQAQSAELGRSTDEYNTEVRTLSQTVDTYNEALRDKPEEGLYIQDKNGRRIIIYFYNTSDELIHTLAHEFGHALGIDHVNDPTAIMFSRTNNVTIPAAEDITELSKVCRKRSYFETANERIQQVIALYKESLK